MHIKDARGQRVLVVDIDGVLHRGSLPAKWHERVVTSLGLQSEAYVKYTQARKKYRQGLCTAQEHTARFVDSWMAAITQLSYSEALAVSEELIRDEGFDNFIFPSNLVKQARLNHMSIIALSRCPTFILEVYNALFQFDHIIGANWEVSDGSFSGLVLNPDILDDKRHQLTACLQKNLVSTDFENSIGIGDTKNDAGWLDLFGHRIAFNPDEGLLVYARSNPQAYMVVHEHKDVAICPQFEDIVSPQLLAKYYLDGCVVSVQNVGG